MCLWQSRTHSVMHLLLKLSIPKLGVYEIRKDGHLSLCLSLCVSLSVVLSVFQSVSLSVIIEIHILCVQTVQIERQVGHAPLFICLDFIVTIMKYSLLLISWFTFNIWVIFNNSVDAKNSQFPQWLCKSHNKSNFQHEIPTQTICPFFSLFHSTLKLLTFYFSKFVTTKTEAIPSIILVIPYLKFLEFCM